MSIVGPQSHTQVGNSSPTCLMVFDCYNSYHMIFFFFAVATFQFMTLFTLTSLWKVDNVQRCDTASSQHTNYPLIMTLLILNFEQRSEFKSNIWEEVSGFVDVYSVVFNINYCLALLLHLILKYAKYIT